MNNKELFDILQKIFLVDGVMHKRYVHTVGVIEMALTLNKVHNLGIDENKIMIACGLHDMSKLMPKENMLEILNDNYPDEFDELLEFPQIWHGYVARIVAEEKYNIKDKDILNAIKYHTTGRIEMSNLEKIVFLSDYIEKNTRISDAMVETRKIAYNNLDKAVVKSLEDTIEYLTKENKKIYQKTLETYQYYLNKGKCDV